MANSINEIIKKVTQASTSFEKNNSDLKRRYLVRNIQLFNYIVSLIDGNQGSFGTGYPFYVLQKDLSGKLPIIKEHVRYSEELINEAKKCSQSEWICEDCLTENDTSMKDLKHACKPCPNMDDGLKPRKLMNRLPDLDMWMVCKDGQIEKTEKKLAELLEKFNIHTSDIDPVQTIKDMEEISEDIKNGNMPNKFLPIDAHIIEYSVIKRLIEQVPDEIEKAEKNNRNAFLLIHPKSYRKVWQYDEDGYNFVSDFLAAFTEFNLVESLDEALKQSRLNIVNKYSPEKLYEIYIQATNEASKRRHKTPELSQIFKERVNGWKPKKEFWMLDDEER